MYMYKDFKNKQKSHVKREAGTDSERRALTQSLGLLRRLAASEKRSQSRSVQGTASFLQAVLRLLRPSPPTPNCARRIFDGFEPLSLGSLIIIAPRN